MHNVVPFDYQGQSVRFNTDGWVNATDIAKRQMRNSFALRFSTMFSPVAITSLPPPA